MRVTDPNATKWIHHESDPAAEFEISAAMPANERTRLMTEIQRLQNDGVVDTAEAQKFYAAIAKKHLKNIRGPIQDADGNPLDCSNVEKLIAALSETRLPNYDNVALWLGHMIYGLNVLSDDEKKRLKFALNTRNGVEPTP
jgi:hypothetical protein